MHCQDGSLREREGLVPLGIWGDLGPSKRHWGAEVPSQQGSALPVPPMTPAFAEDAGATDLTRGSLLLRAWDGQRCTGWQRCSQPQTPGKHQLKFIPFPFSLPPAPEPGSVF